MAKVFDEENVHHFWGLSPSLDVLDLLHRLPVAISQHGVFERLAGADAIHILQVACAPAEHYNSMRHQSRGRACMFRMLTSRALIADWSK